MARLESRSRLLPEVPVETIAHPLAWIREEHGWSQADLARLLVRAARRRGERCGADRNRIWKWENGTVPCLDSQLLLSEVLEVPAAALEAGWPRWLPAHEHPTLTFTPHASRSALLESLVTHLDRRSFLVYTSSSLIALSRQWATTDTVPAQAGRLERALKGGQCDQALVDWLDARTTELRALAATHGQAVEDLVTAHLSAVHTLIDTSRHARPTTVRLYSMAAQLAITGGWLAFDAGRLGAAQRRWHAAVHAAHQADDRDLGAGALADLAYLESWASRPGHAVEILTHARTRTRSPAARALLGVRTARALAVLGDRAGTTRAALAAAADLDRARPRTTPDWVSWMSAADLEADLGRCELDLARPDRAQATITRGLDLLDPARTRTRTVFLVYRAEAFLTQHDLPAATHSAHQALDTALASRADRCITLVKNLLPRLSPHAQGSPHVREFVESAHLRLTAA